jgi:hypothetical protein
MDLGARGGVCGARRWGGKQSLRLLGKTLSPVHPPAIAFPPSRGDHPAGERGEHSFGLEP